MKVLVINSGSSSIKYQLFDMDDQSALVVGILEEIGGTGSRLKHRKKNNRGGFTEHIHTEPTANHHEGFRVIMEVFSDPNKGWNLGDLSGIGHRVVHGGEAFREPTLIDDSVIATIRSMIPLAPLHNPANLTGVEWARDHFPEVAQVAVFDTAYHQTMPPHAYHYAVPYTFYTDHHVRRYGFHGTSHRYVAKQAAVILGKPLETLNMITLHLGNGSSATAIRGGKSIDHSMGMTPLEGLVMGTRCGDLDPAIQGYLARVTEKTCEEIGSIFENQSGLRGVCGISDMREVLRAAESGDPRASLALDMFCYRIRKYIGAYFAALGRLDALVFTGGIGENSPEVRRRCCEGLASLGIALDEHRNQAGNKQASEIQSDESRVKVLVVPTNEELEIAIQTVECIQTGSPSKK
ncbi:MAG: acetate kinase [Desulfomonile tiedjei]|nr:acetate kinase [Desulfomonile tiedjei]